MLVMGCGGPTPGGGGTDGATEGDASTTSSSGGPGQEETLPGGTGDATGDPADSTTASESSNDTTASGEDSSSGTGGSGGSFADCFADQFVNEPEFLPDYDQFEPVIGSHCVGTDHQDIEGVERVVFLGDSVTVGSRPTLPADSYRSVLAQALGAEFGLAGAGDFLWQSPNPVSGQSVNLHAQDFSSCAEWGARNDDLLVGTQLDTCFDPEDFEQRTLVVMTSGGNDLSSLAQDAIDGVPFETLQQTVDEFVALKREAVEWLIEPGRFPNGVFVVFANIYEFTDGTADVLACDASSFGGFDQPVPSPEELTELIVYANEQYMSIAVDTGTDMHFLLETFCGHGFSNDDPAAPCYRGPDTPRWFDFTCIHPNPTGHGVLAENFLSVVLE